MDCWRQWIRHRTASVNEYSTRYSIAIDACQETAPKEWRLQSNLNKQGSCSHFSEDDGKQLSEAEYQLHKHLKNVYSQRLEKGVAREQARKDLPLSTYTEAYWKIDLHNLLHFLSLRMDSHAQYEIRQYADLIGNKIVSRWVPHTWAAFQDYRLNSLNLSGTEIRFLNLLHSGEVEALFFEMQESGWLNNSEGEWVQNREAKEFSEKLSRMGLSVPWA
jgi:thymidylate synthase (FAD)